MNPRLGHTMTIAAVIQCLMRMLWRLKSLNQRWRIYDHFLVGENRWRAQRYGITKGLIDFGRGEVVPFADLVEELIALLAPDAQILGCTRELEGARDILATGNSAQRQRAVRDAALEAGASPDEAMKEVSRSLIDEFHADL